MKKFVFTNEKYQNIKEKEFDLLKLDMKNVDKEIDISTIALAELGARFASERAAFEDACKQGVGSGELVAYQGYFDFLQERREEEQERRNALLARKQEIADMLVRVNNELRVLEEMRAEQYEAYCKEVAAEEAKELDTHMSFSMFERAV